VSYLAGFLMGAVVGGFLFFFVGRAYEAASGDRWLRRGPRRSGREEN
jgi:hypothetical protein